MLGHKGVSPVIATILLIAITVVAIGVIVLFVSSLPSPTPPISASIEIEGATAGSRDLYIKHMGGDTISDAIIGVPAFPSGYNGSWKNMIVGSPGGSGFALYFAFGYAWFNGGSIGEGPVDFKAGDILHIDTVVEFYSGVVIQVIYVPANQILAEVEVR